jgi:transposase-like protein
MTPQTTLAPDIGKVLKREEMMAERDICVDHSTVLRWVIKVMSLFEMIFRKQKRPVGKSWRVDETRMKIKGPYLYRALEKAANTVDFLFRGKRDNAAVRRFFDKTTGQNGSLKTVTIQKSGTNVAAPRGERRARDAYRRLSDRVFEQRRGAGPSSHAMPSSEETATAAMGGATTFRSGREFAAGVELVATNPVAGLKRGICIAGFRLKVFYDLLFDQSISSSIPGNAWF